MDDSIEDIDKKEDTTAEEQNTDIDFVYNDADEYSVEISELYSYSEDEEFQMNRNHFESYLRRNGKFPVHAKWFEISSAERHSCIQRLLDDLESKDYFLRLAAKRSLLYLLQGNFGDCELEEDQITWARRNVYLFIETGVFHAVTQLLLYEIDYDSWATNLTGGGGSGNATSAGNESAKTDKKQTSQVTSTRRLEIDPDDSELFRITLSILYIMVETVRDEMLKDRAQQQQSSSFINGRDTPPVDANNQTSNNPMAKLREQFVEDLVAPIGNDGNLTLAIVLFDMVHSFCSGDNPYFPMKKVLLLLWKILLVTLGPVTSLFTRKNQARARYGLPPLVEDSTQVIRRVRANSPPAISTDQLLARIPRNNNRHPVFSQSNQAPRQGCLAGGRAAFEQQQQQQQQKQSVVTTVTFPFSADSSKSPSSSSSNLDLSQLRFESSEIASSSSDLNQSNTNSQVVLPGLSNLYIHEKSLPWKPKVKKKDIETFLNNVRQKFVGFQVPNDTVSLAGLPEPIHEAVRVMREHLYISLGEIQIERENIIAQNPLSMSGESLPDTPAERLYRAMYPLLPQYMIALLKILLAASPTTYTDSETINIMGEAVTDAYPTYPVSTAIYNVDRDRHKEIIVKAISGILLLLLKQFKLNHIYQFEYVSQYLVFANCIPLILKFFNQNTCKYVQAKNTITCLDFPARHIGKPLENLTVEMLVADWTPCCWRNLFSCINLLRILNMLTKWKHSRIM
ncbi:unnamed protein product [Heterobilharzia americana]|nr:unnamed protein product [Heterobilharzia americana]